MNACACMGPQNGAPVCPCRMRASDLPANFQHAADISAPNKFQFFPQYTPFGPPPYWPNQTRELKLLTEADVRRIVQEELQKAVKGSAI